MKRAMNILSGLAEDAEAGHPWFNAKRSTHDNHAIEAASAKVRQTMPWLENDA